MTKQSQFRCKPFTINGLPPGHPAAWWPRHLAQRIHSLLKEVSVSQRRLISSYASIAAILVLTAWFVAASFPLRGSPQVEVQQRAVVDQPGISVQPGGTLLHRTPVRYPAEAVKNRIEGVVVVSLSLNADGTVSDARILSGPDELRRTVLESVLQWHYLREASGVVQATIEFRLPEAPPSPPPASARAIAPVRAPTPQSLPVIESIDVSSLPEPLQGMMKSRLSSFEGQPIISVGKITEAAREVDSHVQIMLRSSEAGKGVTLVIGLPGSMPTSAAANFPSTPGRQRIRVGGDVQASKLISQPTPEYPPLAQQARISGVVRINAVIGTDGKVQNLTLVQGHPLLVPAAQEAVKGYVYQSTLLNGQPVEVQTQIDVNFTLQ
jgi:TonB family protein